MTLLFYVITKDGIKNQKCFIGGWKMARINVRKRGKVYEYFFEGAKVNNKRNKKRSKYNFR